MGRVAKCGDAQVLRPVTNVKGKCKPYIKKKKYCESIPFSMPYMDDFFAAKDFQNGLPRYEAILSALQAA